MGFSKRIKSNLASEQIDAPGLRYVASTVGELSTWLALAQSLTPIIATVPTTAAAAVHKIAIVGCAIAAIDATTKVTYTASACGSITLCAQA
jgi:hypothetical protein